MTSAVHCAFLVISLQKGQAVVIPHFSMSFPVPFITGRRKKPSGFCFFEVGFWCKCAKSTLIVHLQMLKWLCPRITSFPHGSACQLQSVRESLLYIPLPLEELLVGMKKRAFPVVAPKNVEFPSLRDSFPPW